MTVGTLEKLARQDESLQVTMASKFLSLNEIVYEVLLGVVIQQNLKWSSHVSILSQKLKTRLSVLERLRRVNDTLLAVFLIRMTNQSQDLATELK